MLVNVICDGFRWVWIDFDSMWQKVKKNNEDQKLIKEEWIHSLAKIAIKGPKVDILEK